MNLEERFKLLIDADVLVHSVMSDGLPFGTKGLLLSLFKLRLLTEGRLLLKKSTEALFDCFFSCVQAERDELVGSKQQLERRLEAKHVELQDKEEELFLQLELVVRLDDDRDKVRTIFGPKQRHLQRFPFFHTAYKSELFDYVNKRNSRIIIFRICVCAESILYNF